MRLDRDLAVGAGGLVLAGVYYSLSLDIQRSLLSDAVGPQGLPALYAWTLGILAVALITQSLLRAGVPPTVDGGSAAVPTSAAHARAIGLLVPGVAYLVLIGPLGYLVTIFLLIIGVAAYVGGRVDTRLVIIAAIGAGLLWAIFAHLFQLGLPTGTLWRPWFG
ncbi:MAG: tripartite tricarboxylate transporter TctB family protein [Casimicrobiaceae bacterium]